MTNTLSQADIDIITKQLGRTPSGIRSVAHYSPTGVPQVLEMETWVFDQPFPTLYWLSSSRIDKALARIESQGVVKELEQRIKDDPSLRDAYHASHRDYISRRWDTMSDDHKQIIEQKGFTHLFETLGIGGIKNWDQVRCLHMQYGHHLVGDNVIGKILDEEYGIREIADAETQ
ncbi:DUF501 domain-containing protein [Marinomonas piezotolerans]|uniref:DUF501 domain-containing protein n=1 Tax=Marinomonas piezotolerans TaxID=2213058 RepID=A0A370U4N5_9GAMM|nr:DUF501 domain-containing protein [Marinomonas piezotolerans]RDL42736.1 DUF501 domain-containing protein [Marinomonas piezotolerans]